MFTFTFRVLSGAVQIFQGGQEEVTLSVNSDKLSLQNYVDDEAGITPPKINFIFLPHPRFTFKPPHQKYLISSITLKKSCIQSELSVKSGCHCHCLLC